MSLKVNIAAGYAAQIYVTLIGILILPLYLKYMGVEAYGLVGFFTLLQAWFNVLDLGLTPTIARETARYHSGATDAISYRQLVRALQVLFFSIALIAGGAILLCAGVIADTWLNVQVLDLSQVHTAVQLMIVGVALRWIAGLYRGCVTGSEKIVWLSGFSAFVATLRFVLVVPVLIWVGNSPVDFFAYQLLVATIELIVIARKAISNFPKLSVTSTLRWRPSVLILSLRPLFRFAMTLAFTSTVWIGVTQADKLILSNLLTLTEYGYFTLAVFAASGVVLISTPISTALLPRMANLQAAGNERELAKLYRNASQLVAVIVIPTCLVLAFFSEQVIWTWTGDLVATKHSAPLLKLYALGYGVFALGALPYYLQYAKGDLKLHLIGNVLFALILIPGLVLASLFYGSKGAAWAWLSANCVYFIVWIPLIHHRFLKGQHARWLLDDLGPVFLVVILITVFIVKTVSWPNHRFESLVYFVLLGLILVFTAAASSSFIRACISSAIRVNEH